MKIKNISQRNISCLAPHGNAGKRFMVPAGSTLEIDDELYGLCSKAAEALIKAGVLVVVPTKKEEVAKKAVEKAKGK